MSLQRFVVTGITFYLLTIAYPVMAQTRGEGVGALLGNFTGATKITVTNGKTAPQATVFIQDENGTIQVEAALDDQGIFSFTFGTEPGNVNKLYIFASDTAGTTRKISIPGTKISNILLPPTIAVEPKPTTSRVVIYGYTFPGADIELSVRSSEGKSRRYQALADSSRGKWTVSISRLEEGIFTAEAVARIGGTESEQSNQITIHVNVSILTRVFRAAAPLLIVPAAAATLSPGSLAFGDVPYYVARLLLFLRGVLFFWRRKRIRWGVVYDGLTKHPVSGAIVRLYRDVGGLVETEVTGGTGSFSFLPQPGRYTMRVTKPGFIFPSRIVEGKLDGEYELVYHGEVFDVRNFKTPLSLSLALDPEDQSVTGWRSAIRQFNRRYGILFQACVIILGVTMSVLAATVNPAWYNLLLIGMYGLLGILLIIRYWRDSTVWGKVVDEEGNPVPLVSLSLLETTFHHQVQRRVSDMFGRYQFVAPAGTYAILVSSAGWELVQTRNSYDGTSLKISKQADLVKPTVVVRKKGLSPSFPQV